MISTLSLFVVRTIAFLCIATLLAPSLSFAFVGSAEVGAGADNGSPGTPGGGDYSADTGGGTWSGYDRSSQDYSAPSTDTGGGTWSGYDRSSQDYSAPGSDTGGGTWSGYDRSSQDYSAPGSDSGWGGSDSSGYGGGYTNTGNNPGNPNAPGYFGSTYSETFGGNYSVTPDVDTALGDVAEALAGVGIFNADLSTLGLNSTGGVVNTDNSSLPSNPGQLGGLNYGSPEIGTPIGPNAITQTDEQGNVTVNIGTVPAPGPATTFTPAELGDYVTLDTVQSTPARELARGNWSIGTAPESLQDKARAAGFDLDDPATIAALAFAHEITPQTRADIVAAYREDPSLSTLDNEAIQEAAANLNSFTNMAAFTNRSLAEQLAVPSYVSSITVDQQAFDTLSNPETRAALEALAGQLTDGTMANARGLDVAAPAGTANHTHSTDPDAFESGRFPGWSSAMTDVVDVGGYTQTRTGLISSEGNPVSESALNTFNTSPNLTTPTSLIGIDVTGQMTPATNGLGVAAQTTDSTGFVGIDPDAFADSLTAPTWDGTLGGVNVSQPSLNISDLGDLGIGTGRGVIGSTPVNSSIPNSFDPSAISPNITITAPDVVYDFTAPPQTYTFGPTGVQRSTCDSCVTYSITGDDRPNDVNDSYRQNLETAMGILSSKYPGITATVWSGTHEDPDHDPAKDNGVPSGRHAHGNGGDVTFSINGQTVTDTATLADIAQTIAAVSGGIAGIGYSNSSQTITHVDFEPNPTNGYHGTWGYSGPKSAEIQSAFEQGTQGQLPAGTSQVATFDPNEGTDQFSGITGALGLEGVAEVDDPATFEREGVSFVSPSEFDALTAPTEVTLDATIEVGAPPAGGGLGGTGGGLAGRLGETISDILGWFGIDFNLGGGGGGTAPQGGDGSGTSTPQQQSSIRINSQMPASVGLAAAAGDAEGGMLNTVSNAIRNVFAWIFSDESETETYANFAVQVAHASSTPYVTIIIQVDETAGTVTFTRGPVQHEELLLQRERETEERYDTAPADGVLPPLVFNNAGEIVYSDGRFAPPTASSGVTFGEETLKYVYMIQTVRDGKVTSAEVNRDGLPGNIFTNSMKRMFSDDSPFTLADIDTVTYVSIDPNTTRDGDEYRQYTVMLTDGSIRSVDVPVKTSLDFYRRQFEAIGFRGDVFALTELGTETDRLSFQPEPDLLDRLMGGISAFFSGNDNDEQFADLADLSTQSSTVGDTLVKFTDKNLVSALIYLDVPFPCPAVPGYTEGYVYEVTVDLENDEKNGVVRGALCGTGTSEVYAKEVAEDLVERGLFSSLTSNVLHDKLLFRFYETTPGAVTDDTEVIPNTTNQIVLEAKVTTAGGQTVTNWTQNSVVVGAGQQLHLRWNASEYRRCLPFIADNGAYSLTRTDLAMTSGNTEAEGYDVIERTGTYRLECDGQSNREDGVDERRIEVTVE